MDVDAAEIEKLAFTVDVPVVADAKDFLTELNAGLTGFELRDWSEWLGRCVDWRKRYPVLQSQYWDEPHYVNQYCLMEALSDELAPEDMVVPGSSGACSEVTMQAIRVRRGVRILNSQGLGSMGFGIPAAIGACLAFGRTQDGVHRRGWRFSDE